MGPVEKAIRRRFTTPVTLHTYGQQRPFVLESLDDRGIVLLLGAQRNYTPMSWECLEGIIPFLRSRPGWVNAGGTYEVSGAIGTLDEHLKNCLSRQTSRWVTVVLQEASLVDVDQGPPLRLRLR
jgi:hypothetical protein